MGHFLSNRTAFRFRDLERLIEVIDPDEHDSDDSDDEDDEERPKLTVKEIISIISTKCPSLVTVRNGD